jgi:xylulokinase
MTGTSTVLMFPNTTGVVEPAFIAMPHAIPGLRLLLGAMVASGGSLRWFRDQLGAGEVMQAAQTGADAFDLIFLPYMMGERAPIWHTQARGVFIGLTLATTRAAMVRAVLEGTAFAMLHNIEVARAAGVPVNEIRSVGGGARSPLWNQIKADVTGLPVLLPQAGVGAPFGDAMLAGLGAGMFTDLHRAVAERVRIAAIFEPNPETHVRYQAIYPHFRSIYAHLRQDFDDMAATFARFSLPGER